MTSVDPITQLHAAPQLRALMKHFGDFTLGPVTDWYENVLERSGLDARAIELIVTALLATADFEAGVQIHAERALAAGATPADVRGAILLTWGFSGSPSAAKGLTYAEPVLARVEADAQTRSDDSIDTDRRSATLKGQAGDYWNVTLRAWLDALVEESGLDARTARLVACALAAYGRSPEALRDQIAAARARGASIDDVRGALLLSSVIGGPGPLVDGLVELERARGVALITTDAAWTIPESFSATVRHGDLVFVCGQLGADPGGVEVPFEQQARTALARLLETIEGAGGNVDGIVRVGAYLADIEDFERFDAVYRELLPGNPKPVRTTIQVGGFLPPVLIEVDAIAAARRSSGAAAGINRADR